MSRPRTTQCMPPCTGTARLMPAKAWITMRTPGGRLFVVPMYRCELCSEEIVPQAELMRVERITGIQIRTKS